MQPEEYFGDTYADARQRFLQSVAESGNSVTSFVNNFCPGERGEALVTDVALFGDPQSQNLLVLVSGTHGVEGFCGSGAQVGLIREKRLDPPAANTATLLIHAINPYGFSWLRRVNEDNVDLNRNSIEHANPPATHADYTALHPHLIPEDWDGESRRHADEVLAHFVAERGHKALQAAVSLGQYTHPDGLFYGGRALAWSTRTFQEILRRWASGKKRVALIDFHTGLGPSGYGEPIFTEPDPTGLRRALAWYGNEVTSIFQGDSASTQVQGALINGARWVLPEAELTPLALEFGTLPSTEVINALRADQWLELHGVRDSELGRQIKAQVRDSFYVQTPAWEKAVLERSFEFVGKALTALSRAAP
ncbi:MAG: M14 family metallopeptidase [Burkholderiaceae bacterium]|jgi:hypothetical protein